MVVSQAAGPNAGPAPWVVEASVAGRVVLPGGCAVDRDAFHAWLWDEAEGLLGVDEGTVTAVDAASQGIVAAGPVIDAAAAPIDRDWVAALPVATVSWWFSTEATARAAAVLVAGVGGCTIRTIRPAESIDHEADARAGFGPVPVEGFGIVRPAWEAGRAGGAVPATTIFIEPGIGFGTGLHETTQLCLAAIADWHRCGGRLDRVLDFGSGSGILGIAAAVLGAARVDAVEIDERVHATIGGNARRNGVVERLGVTTAIGVAGSSYDLIVANIVAPVLLEHAADLCGRLRTGRGCVVLSGLLAADVPEVADRYAARLETRPAVGRRGDWHCLSFVVGRITTS